MLIEFLHCYPLRGENFEDFLHCRKISGLLAFDMLVTNIENLLHNKTFRVAIKY